MKAKYMVKLLLLFFAGTCLLLATGCSVITEDGYRFGAEPQYYDIKKINVSFDTPNIMNRWNIGWYLGKEFQLYKADKRRLTTGFDLRLNHDIFDDNRSSHPSDYGDCVEKGRFSMVTQDWLTYIPFFGFEQDIGEGDLFLEMSFPYTKWIIETGDTEGLTCFENRQYNEKFNLGQRIRFGLKGFGEIGPCLTNIYLTYETHNTSIIEVDVWSFGFVVLF